MLPRFLVIGAQKAGTTALCAMLDSHPGIGLSRPKEPMFFSRDEPAIHPYFFMQERERWTRFDWDIRRDDLLAEYTGFFSHLPSHAICGEGSTTYLCSEKAPSRVRAVIPDVKIIVSLRDPVQRIYSAYWHFVRLGVSIHGFENFLLYEPIHSIYMGEYKTHLQRWFSQFSRDQFHIIIFERFVAQPQSVLDEVCAFLGVGSINNLQGGYEENRAHVPRFILLQYCVNLTRRLVGQDLSAVPGRIPLKRSRAPQLVGNVLERISTWNLRERHYPPMEEDVRRHLTSYYKRVNDGLSELIGQDVHEYWYGAGDRS